MITHLPSLGEQALSLPTEADLFGGWSRAGAAQELLWPQLATAPSGIPQAVKAWTASRPALGAVLLPALLAAPVVALPRPWLLRPRAGS